MQGPFHISNACFVRFNGVRFWCEFIAKKTSRKVSTMKDTYYDVHANDLGQIVLDSVKMVPAAEAFSVRRSFSVGGCFQKSVFLLVLA